MPNRELLIKQGWRQGLVLPTSDTQLTENARREIGENDRLLIVSQTCDLIHESFDREPYFEVLCLHPLDKEPEGGYRGGKNSRRIEFSLELVQGNASDWYALPYERHLVDRNLLIEKATPCTSIEDGQTLEMILRWLSRRYTRTAFPEAFVNSMNTRKREIGKKLSRLNASVSNVYIRLLPFEELDDGSEYSIELMLVMDAVIFDDKTHYQNCDAIRKQLENQLTKCDGIVVDNVSIESTASLTIEDLKGYLEWDYSYLSFRDPHDAATPVDL